jgi:hypothetical protein
MLSVPVFIVMVGMTVLIAGSLESIGLASLRPLLLLQFMLLAGFLAQCVAAGPYIEPNATNAILAGMLGGSAMAVQNALVQISLKGAPSTAVMTSNVTRFALDVSKVLFGGDPADMAKARNRAARTLAVIVGFATAAWVRQARRRLACGHWCRRLASPCSRLQWDLRPSPPRKSLMSEAGLWASSPSVQVSGRWPHARLTSALWSATPTLLFGLRLWAAVCLALYVAFWLQLDNAYWAGTSAAIVCQPSLGASLRKGWFRMVGTAIGAVAIVVLTAYFPQERTGFLLGLALWGAACGFLATLLRNFAAYSAALAGYTAAIIASDELGAVGGANGDAFMLAITRASEICIGIVCAGVVLAGTDFGGARRRLAVNAADH